MEHAKYSKKINDSHYFLYPICHLFIFKLGWWQNHKWLVFTKLGYYTFPIRSRYNRYLINSKLKCYFWTSLNLLGATKSCDSHQLLVDFHNFYIKLQFFPILLRFLIPKVDVDCSKLAFKSSSYYKSNINIHQNLLILQSFIQKYNWHVV